MKTRIWRISVLLLIACGSTSLLAGDKALIPTKIGSNAEILLVLKRLERYVDDQLFKIPQFHIQRITMDSASSLDTEIVMRDSNGTVVRFSSRNEWVGSVQNIGHWINGTNYAAWNLGSVAPKSDSSFRLIRPYGIYHDTISLIAIGARRQR